MIIADGRVVVVRPNDVLEEVPRGIMGDSELTCSSSIFGELLWEKMKSLSRIQTGRLGYTMIQIPLVDM